MTQGIIYYNYGTGSAARLAVSIYNLRKFWHGDVTILSDGDISNELCKRFAKDSRLGVTVKNSFFDVRKDRNHHYLSKCRLAEQTPYDLSLYIDADTIPVKPMDELFGMAEQYQFVVPQFCNWRSDSGGVVTKRIKSWSAIRPRDIEPALKFGPAVNTGVMAFTKDNPFMKDWFKIARKGRDLFIPDETSCQVMLYRYPHKIVGWYYNASCKYDDIFHPDVRVYHYHGKKHCREGLPHHGDIWVKAYEEACHLNIAEINDWTPGDDRKLRFHLQRLAKVKS